MKTGRYILLLCLSMHVSMLFSQSMEEIKKKQEQTEKEINYLNKLLSATRNDQTATLDKLTLLNQKIIKAKEMVVSLKEEVNLLEKQLENNTKKRERFQADRQKTLDLYASMVVETWKKRDRSDKLATIFASADIGQAYARYKYFASVQDYSKRQLAKIARTSDSLLLVNKNLNALLSQKNKAQKEMSVMNSELLKEQNRVNDFVASLKKQERELTKKLQAEIKNREKYKKELQKLIDNQIKKSGSSTSKYNLTPEEKLISEDFAKNKGRLPWPVAEGFISEKFGVNVSPLARQVKLNNDGITITTSENAEVRAVFGGVVSEIMFIPGQNNVILIRHGNYFSLYNNIIEVFVKKGDQVKVKQRIGKLAVSAKGSSTINFQIWKDREILNPQGWLSK